MRHNHYKIFSVLPLYIIIAWLGLVSYAQAQSPNWNKVAEFASTTTELDINSVESVSQKGYAVKFRWRRIDSLSVLTTESVATCYNFEMTNLTGVIENKIYSTKREFSYSASPNFKDSKVVYGRISRLDGPGAVIRAACFQIYPERIRKLEEPFVDCNAMASPVDRLYCKKDSELSASIELFASRALMLPDICGYKSSQAENILLYFMGQATKCDSVACAKSKVASGLEMISRDLAEAKNEAKSCSSARLVTEWVNESRQKELSVAAFKQYVDCTRSATSRLDDGISSAEIVARGLHGACIGPFNESLRFSPTLKGDGGDAIYREIEPQLVQIVLEGRVRQRKPTKSK